jgi:hypothetical protein
MKIVTVKAMLKGVNKFPFVIFHIYCKIEVNSIYEIRIKYWRAVVTFGKIGAGRAMHFLRA